MPRMVVERWVYAMAYWVSVIFIVSNLPRTYGYMGATMGVAQQSCDDGKTNLIVDWDYGFTAYSCMGTIKWKSNPEIAPLYYTIPNFNARKDQVWHYCMNTSILYKDRPPIRGHHRPLWAKYGEYLYVPPQRWLHNLEHGSIVMLYHPCADEEQVNKLRQLVTSCIWRHIITPYDKLSNDRPFALVAWGAKLEMNTVDVIQAVLFMKKHAHVAPEDLSKEGQYDEMLLRPASMVSDKDDSAVCPWVPTTNINADNTQLSRNMVFGTRR